MNYFIIRKNRTDQVFTYSQSRDHVHMEFSVSSRIRKYVDNEIEDLNESKLKKQHDVKKSTVTYLRIHTIYFLTSESNVCS